MNVRRDQTPLSTSHHVHNTPTLPINLDWPSSSLSLSSPSSSLSPEYRIDRLHAGTTRSPLALPTLVYPETITAAGDVVAGPIPKSWAAAKPNKCVVNDPRKWRIDALSVVLSRLPSGSNLLPSDFSSENILPPPLTLLCFRVLLSSYSDVEFAEHVIPYLPPHLRRDLLRYTAVHSPLPNSKLYALCEPEGHCDGELIVVGPRATLRSNHFRRTPVLNLHYCEEDIEDSKVLDSVSDESVDSVVVEDWDTLHEDQSSHPPLQTFILISSHISAATLLTLPPTIVHLALINLPSPVPLHRLPGICPLITVLDVSYNKWLVQVIEGRTALEKIIYSRWTGLKVLVLRGCSLTRSIQSINRGRWIDVEIIQ